MSSTRTDAVVSGDVAASASTIMARWTTAVSQCLRARCASLPESPISVRRLMNAMASLDQRDAVDGGAEPWAARAAESVTFAVG
jgi:hypothetical protein